MESFVAGAAAGLVVDLTLHPIDTIKTRVQSKAGFYASGGFTRVYKGLSAVLVGSIPCGAAFFFTYDTVKQRLLRASHADDGRPATVSAAVEAAGARVLVCQSVAAVCGETAACCVRAPVEMVKQRMQVGYHHSIADALRSIAAARSTTQQVATGAHSCRDGSGANSTVQTSPPARRGHVARACVRRLFAGMPVLLMREWPFSVTQMTLYELLKRRLHRDARLQPYTYALLPVCGAVSGGCAAFVTTPIDVVKTRIMLLQHNKARHAATLSPLTSLQQQSCAAVDARGGGGAAHVRALTLLRCVVRDVATEPQRPGDVFGVAQKFFRGATARVAWISLGGSVFFGTYEVVKRGMHVLRSPTASCSSLSA